MSSDKNKNKDYTIKSNSIINGFPNYFIKVISNSVKIISNHVDLPTIYMKDGSVGVYLTKGEHTLIVSYKKHFLQLVFLQSLELFVYVI
ncbi:unnamed protein product [Commensalibacter papalotli (ex Botero et al. 2024)]|uniref:Uncharacterized protein n=1 Tax=Commensalibacter papalotli (ex Botero et al. 2024) TaxID=2972766 RepID=A0ABM9HHQ5_9PROT|nr:unnamed protein product [Commensalibacter papalotli (ex Botero et al. 2024)]CAI3929712.1 unnamed protein product [Commensalibacter papalotli (ex Botero et al. 2024)]